MLNYLQRILQLIISPARGWEDISAAGITPGVLTRRGFYPLLAITVISCMIKPLYHSADYSLISALISSIITFTRFFVTLFLASYAFSIFMPAIAGNANSQFKNLTCITYTLGALMLINLISNLLYLDLVIVTMLPLYVIFVVFKATRYLDVEQDHEGHFMMLALLTLIAPPYIISFLFNLLIPQI